MSKNATAPTATATANPPAPGHAQRSAPRFCPLADGRRLCYAEWGEPTGTPLLLFHGLPGSRLQYCPAPALEAELGVRVITIDRPGLGRSDPLPGRRFMDWPADVAQLLDHLGIDRAPIVGVSGGGPYAMACGTAIPERVERLVLMSPMAPRQFRGAGRGLCLPVRGVFALARWLPGPLRAIMPTVRRISSGGSAAASTGLLRFFLPPDDMRLLQDPELQAILNADADEASVVSVVGVHRECVLLNLPWDFDVADVAVPARLYHGDADTIVPVTMAHYLAEHLPDCRTTILPDLGHFMVFDMQRTLLTAALGRD